jgi:hypothetical protein
VGGVRAGPRGVAGRARGRARRPRPWASRTARRHGWCWRRCCTTRPPTWAC